MRLWAIRKVAIWNLQSATSKVPIHFSASLGTLPMLMKFFASTASQISSSLVNWCCCLFHYFLYSSFLLPWNFVAITVSLYGFYAYWFLFHLLIIQYNYLFLFGFTFVNIEVWYFNLGLKILNNFLDLDAPFSFILLNILDLLDFRLYFVFVFIFVFIWNICLHVCVVWSLNSWI